MRSVAASTVVAPTCWTNAPRPASQNRVNTSWKIRSRVSYHFASGAGNERLVAKRIARSKATQHIIREKTNSCRPPRTSQMPSSGRCQFAESQSISRTRFVQASYPMGEPYLSYRYTESISSP